MKNSMIRFVFSGFILSGLLLFVSCMSEKTEPITQKELVRISAQRRFDDLLSRGTLRVAVSTGQTRFAFLNSDGLYSGPEVDKIRKAAEKAKLRLFLFEAHPDALPGYVRSGRADLGIGGLKAENILRENLTPVLEYQEGESVYAFASWNDASELEKLLEK